MELTAPYLSRKTKLSNTVSTERFKGLLQNLIVEQNCKISQLLYRADSFSRYQNPERKYNYITFREKQGMISFQPFGKEQKKTDDGKWSRDGRQEVKPAKFAKEFLHPRLIAKFKDHEIAAFATRFKAFEASRQIVFETVSVHEAYFAEYVADINSCMAGKDVGPFYETFGAKAIVAKRKDGKFCGRAILWPNAKIFLEEDQDPITASFMDRIYATSVEVTELFIQWAKEQKYWMKDGQNNGSYRNFISPEGNQVKAKMLVETLDKKSLANISFYPYMDTLLFGADDVSISNTATNDKDDEDCSESYATYRCTGGSREINDNYRSVVDHRGQTIPMSRAVQINGQYYATDDELIVRAYNSYHLLDYRFRENCFQAADGVFYTNSCRDTKVIKDHEGNYYNKSDMIEHDGKWYHTGSEFIVWSNREGQYLHKDNAKRVFDKVASYWSSVSDVTQDYVSLQNVNYKPCSISGKFYHKDLLSLDEQGNWVYADTSSNDSLITRVKKSIKDTSYYMKWYQDEYVSTIQNNIADNNW